MSKAKRPAAAISSAPSGPCYPSEIAAAGDGKENTSERLQHNMENPVNFGKTKSCCARDTQDSVAHDVKGTENGTND